MKQAKRIEKVLIHLSIWLAYILYESSILFIIDAIRPNFWEIAFNFTLYAGVFYLNSQVILPRIFNEKKYLAVFAALLVLAALVPLRYLLYQYVLPGLSTHVRYPYTNEKLFLAQSIWRGGYYTLLSVGYFFSINSLRIERERRKQAEARTEQEQRLRQLEKMLMEAEITNLRNQISPHFLYNALNFFYSRIYPHSEETANGILLLSEMMRYAIKDESMNGKVMLAEEVKHLQNYIAMNQLRFDDRLQVRFELVGSLEFRMIMPLILITFVENCFKHGELLDPAHPLVIRIEVTDAQLFFHTHNKKAVTMLVRTKSTGIGISNIRRRLDLGYPGRYTLALKDETEFYTTDLTLTL
jgi:sensor histidine kinase YesM